MDGAGNGGNGGGAGVEVGGGAVGGGIVQQRSWGIQRGSSYDVEDTVEIFVGDTVVGDLEYQDQRGFPRKQPF